MDTDEALLALLLDEVWEEILIDENNTDAEQAINDLFAVSEKEECF